MTATECAIRQAAHENLVQELVEALSGILGQLSNIEVLGEWSALDCNYSSQKRVRAQVDEKVERARAVLARARGQQ